LSCYSALPVSNTFWHFRSAVDGSPLIRSLSAQGAAQAVEDGAVLGALMERLEQRSQIVDILAIYERLRKNRTTRIVQGSTLSRDIFHMEDSERQRERDRQLRQKPFEQFPNRWADPVFQPWLFGYDAYGEAERAWVQYKQGALPTSAGDVQSRL